MATTLAKANKPSSGGLFSIFWCCCPPEIEEDIEPEVVEVLLEEPDEVFDNKELAESVESGKFANRRIDLTTK